MCSDHAQVNCWSIHRCVHDWLVTWSDKSAKVDHYNFAFRCYSRQLGCIRSRASPYAKHSAVFAHATWLVSDQFWKKQAFRDALDDDKAILDFAKIMLRTEPLLGRSHLITAERLFSKLLERHERVPKLPYQAIMGVAQALTGIYNRSARPRDAGTTLKRALAMADMSLDKDEHFTGRNLLMLGDVCMAAGSVELGEIFQREAMKIFLHTAVLAGNQFSLNTYAEVTIFHLQYPDYEDRRILELCKRSTDPIRRNAVSKAFGGRSSFRLMSKTAAGRERLKGLETASKEMMKSMKYLDESWRPVVLSCALDLTDLYAAQGRDDELRELYDDQLTQDRFSVISEDLLPSYGPKLIYWHRQFGQAEEAERMTRRLIPAMDMCLRNYSQEITRDVVEYLVSSVADLEVAIEMLR